MCDNDNKMDKLGEELGKVFKMGVGAVASAVEKGVTFVEELTTEGTETHKRASELGDKLSRKGETVLDKTAQFGTQLKDKVSGAFEDMDLKTAMGALKSLDKEELLQVKARVEELLAGFAEPEAEETTEKTTEKTTEETTEENPEE